MRRISVVLVVASLVALAAVAEEVRPSRAACDRAKLAGRAYIECLGAAVRTSDQALAAALSRAHAVIDARSELTPAQKARWKNALDEAHGVFLRYRNLECQNVAPYEGSRGIGAFEERLSCLIDKGDARVRDLTSRYGGP
jgi:uncharacterized protein YecT (DUF1311 family)